MKAVVFHQHGGPEQLRYEEVEPPRILPDEVLVRVKACALNHLDIWIRQGIPAYQIPLPHISGCDVAGVVEQVGTAVAGVAVGDRVLVSPGLSCWRCKYCLAGRDNLCLTYKILGAHVNGGYAELVKVPGLNALPMPAALTFEQAAAFPLVSVTAWHMLFTLAGLRPGEDVLVMGAGSGVGSIAIQMAKLAGARVLTTVGSDEKIPKAKALGANEVINHAKEQVMKQVKALTDGRGVDVVVEHIGPEVWDQCFLALAKGGRLVTCGATTGGEATINIRLIFFKLLSILGSTMGSLAELHEIIKHVEAGRLRPIVDRVLPLDQVAEGHRVLENREAFGKVVLEVSK